MQNNQKHTENNHTGTQNNQVHFKSLIRSILDPCLTPKMFQSFRLNNVSSLLHKL